VRHKNQEDVISSTIVVSAGMKPCFCRLIAKIYIEIRKVVPLLLAKMISAFYRSVRIDPDYEQTSLNIFIREGRDAFLNLSYQISEVIVGDNAVGTWSPRNFAIEKLAFKFVV